MQNETNLSSILINSLLNSASKGKADGETVKKIINDNLTSAQQQQLKSLMNDKEKLKEVLSSPQAKELLKKLGDMK